jgi:peptidoglycan/xylan/chitin deacetylase (PgdA/CDA1 family)
VLRAMTKTILAAAGSFDMGTPCGATLLTYHRVGGGSGDELDVPQAHLETQLDLLLGAGVDVLSLDAALDRLDAGQVTPSVVLTFDDGFADVYEAAWPLLRERQLPFTLYLAAGLVGGSMRWEGSAAASQGAPALTWEQLAEMHATGLCTVANHTLDHARPDVVDEAQLDRCSELIERWMGTRPAHFAWPWGIDVPGLVPEVRRRFRSAATGVIGRNLPSDDRHTLRRVPVRSTDPPAFFRAKLRGQLLPERTYGALVSSSKRLRRVRGGA